MWWMKWVVLWSLWAARLVRQPTPPVRVSSGWVRGSIAHSGKHAHFLGIPYATLQGRFQAPGPEPIWDGVFEAIKEDNLHCTQATSLRANTTSGSEHCMILNIFTPLNKSPEETLPVIVYIHGGAYLQRSGSRMTYGPEYLTPKGIVLVTLNYRLNIQGFLCLGIKGAPGNAGLKDQVAALKWVQKNIKAFGGDPDNVTIMGESAGAMSVSLHVVSPMSKGLFHKAIVQSGSSLSPFTIQHDPLQSTSLHAKTMGFNSKDPQKLYDFFMTQSDMNLIINRAPRAEGTTVMTDIPYVPCVEQKVEGEEAFLPDHPYNLLVEGDYNKVPMIIGANIEEGLFLMTLDIDDLILKATFEKSLPKDLVFPSNEIRKKVADEAKQLYMGSDDILFETKAKFSKYYGDPYLVYPVVEETEIIAKTSGQPIYHYLFSYESLRNLPKKLLSKELKTVYGATHADELFYLFSQPIVPSFMEYKMINQMSTMWTNFAKYGDPTPESAFEVRWPAVTSEDKRLLLIDSQITTAPLWHSKSVLFWRDVYSKYRKK